MGFQKAVKWPQVPHKSGVYCITNSVDSEKYVGSSKDINLRWSKHRSDLKRGTHKNKHLQSAYDLHGLSVLSVEVLELVDDLSMLIGREQYYFDTLKPAYNMFPRSDGALGYRHSLETRNQRSISRKGMKFSPEHIANMSRVRMGHPAHNKGIPATETIRMGVSLAQQKLTPEQLTEVRSLIDQKNMPQVAIARKFNVSPATITKIKQGYVYYTEKEN